MSARTCGLCGKPAEGHAEGWDGTAYCHGDGPGPTCYQRATWDDARALKPTRALTPRQRECLDFIVEFIRTRRYCPSLDEIAAALGLRGTATVHKHVVNLARKGYITRDFNRSRSIDVVDPPPTGRPAHCSGCRCEVEEAMEAR